MYKREQRLMMFMFIIAFVVGENYQKTRIIYTDNQDIIKTNIHSIEENIMDQSLIKKQNMGRSLMSMVVGDYEIEKDMITNQVTIIQYNGSASNLVIPETIDGCKVVSIEINAFDYCESLLTVDIPDSVENIMDWAFSDCRNLSSVKIGNSVKCIGMYVFSGCISLVAVDIPDSVENIGEGAFYACCKLSSVNIGKSVKSIEAYTFINCTSLTSIVLPNTLTCLGFDVFEDSSVSQLIFICQDIHNMNISVSDSIPEDIHVYRMAVNKDIIVHSSEIKLYEYIGKSLSLRDIFMKGTIYDGATGTNEYEGSEIKLEDYFDIIYGLIGNKTSNETKIEDNQLHIGEDETSENLSIQVTHGEMNKQVPIQIVKAKSLSIKEEPQNTYYENDTYNPSGLVLTMTYEDGYEKDIEYRADNDEITFEYQTVDMNITEQIIKYKGFEVKQPLTVYGHQTLRDSETKIEITGILANDSILKIERIKDARILNTLNSKKIIVGYDVQIIGEYKDKLTIVFDVGNKNNGKRVYIRHIKHDGSIETFEEIAINGSIKITVTELSSFLVYTDKELDNTPSQPIPVSPIEGNEEEPIRIVVISTDDHNNILFWGVITMTSIATIIFIHKKYRL